MHEDGFVMGRMTLFSTADKNQKLLKPTGTLNVLTGSLPVIPAQNVTATSLPTPFSCWDIHPLPPQTGRFKYPFAALHWHVSSCSLELMFVR